MPYDVLATIYIDFADDDTAVHTVDIKAIYDKPDNKETHNKRIYKRFDVVADKNGNRSTLGADDNLAGALVIAASYVANLKNDQNYRIDMHGIRYACRCLNTMGSKDLH